MGRGAGAADKRRSMSPNPKHAFILFLGAALVFGVPVNGAQTAHAIGADVKNACKSDYFKHCSQHAVGSESLRSCMRKVGEDLSTPCLVALVKAGEVTKQDIEQYKAKQASGGGAAAAKPQSAKPKAVSKTMSKTAAPAVATSKSKRKAAKVKDEPKKSVSKPAEKRAPKTVARPAARPATTSSKARVVAKPKLPEKSTKAARPGATTHGSRPPQVAGWASDGEEIVPRYTHNLCSATTLAGKVETFTCGLDEKCCYGALFNEKYCVPAAKSCY